MAQQRNDVVVNNHIEPSTLREQKPVHVTLKFDRPRETQKRNQQGEYTLYTYGCTFQNQDAVLFAYEGLHRAIQDANATKGDTVTIIKMGDGKQTLWEAWVEGKQTQAGRAVNSNAPAEQPRQTQPPQQTQQRQAQRQPDPQLDQEVYVAPGFREHVAEYAECFSAAVNIIAFHTGTTKVDHTAAQAMAFSLFRSALDRGVEIPGDYRHESAMDDAVEPDYDA